MVVIQTVTNSLSMLVIIAQMCVIAVIVCWVMGVNLERLARNGLVISLVISCVGVVGSLFYSLYAGFTPCELCWYQRIGIYPLVILLGVALWYNDRSVYRYIIPLVGITGVMAGYHYVLQVMQTQGLCPSSLVSCSARYVFTYGYITIPMMSLTLCVAIFVLMLLVRRYE